jgi:hypothetical protein
MQVRTPCEDVPTCRYGHPCTQVREPYSPQDGEPYRIFMTEGNYLYRPIFFATGRAVIFEEIPGKSAQIVKIKAIEFHDNGQATYIQLTEDETKLLYARLKEIIENE